MSKTLVLPNHGSLMVSTDLHGNYEDFCRLREIFASEIRANSATHWAILGDMVHGPSPQFREIKPELYDYDDLSWQIVADIADLQKSYPANVHYVLGNHDYAHIGGPHTRKFYPDEVVALEVKLDALQISQMHNFFRRALLAVVAPCGVLLTHGSPDDTLEKFEDLHQVSYDSSVNNEYQNNILHTFLCHYGQEHSITQKLLERISQQLFPVSVVVHGHDRHEDGWFTEGNNQLCVVIFGALRENKRYLHLDLGKYYRLADIRDGKEILRLYA